MHEASPTGDGSPALSPDTLTGVWSFEEAGEFASTITYLEETENRLSASAGDQPLP